MSSQSPRLILYHQAHLRPLPGQSTPVSILPLLSPHPLTNQPSISHLILAALHLNERPGAINYNDHPYTHPIHGRLFAEARRAQAAGVKVLMMVGGAAGGAFTRLDGDAGSFEAYYGPLAGFVRWSGVDGLDLDVEEGMSLSGIVRLVVRLKADFGPGFLLTMAPVATAMLEPPVPNPDFDRGRRRDGVDAVWAATRKAGVGNLSGFSYQEVERAVGAHIAWYNVQFYCGWGTLWTGRWAAGGRVGGPEMYRALLEQGGWDPRRIVVGTVTNWKNGAGWVPERVLKRVIGECMGAAFEICDKRGVEVEEVPFGGVMGWEYFNSAVRDTVRKSALREEEPWKWAEGVREAMVNFGGEESWDESACVWDGKFGEDVEVQARDGRWR